MVGFVVTERADDAAEMFPATSRARTVYWYAVAAVRPLSVYDALVGEPTFVVPRYTSYPARPEPPVSVDAVHVRATLVSVTVVATRPEGTDGAIVSVVVPGRVVTESADDAAEMFPATSRDRTVYEYAVDAVRPVSEYDVVVVEPTFVVPRYTS